MDERKELAVSVPPEPPRLLDDPSASSALRLALSSAPRNEPSREQIERMRAALLQQTANAPTARAEPPRPRVAWSSWIVRVGLAVVATALWWRVSARTPTAPHEPTPSARPTLVAPAVSEAAHALPDAPVTEPATPSARVEEPPPSRTPRPRPRPDTPRAHALDTASPVDEPVACDESDEEERVQRARDRLRAQDWSTAEALCSDDARACPRGTFAEERERVWIEALVRHGRADAARARWQRFQSTFPTSAYQERLRALVEAQP